MRNVLTYTTGIVGLAIGLAAATAVAQTTANGPYYATPSWDQTLPASTRFIVLSNMNSDAVLDRETGLVWERTPDTTTPSWGLAQAQCVTKTVGNRRGWRVPTIQDLQSLVDPAQLNPTLPAGHPFNLGGPSTAFWSATTGSNSIPSAWIVAFANGGAGLFSKDFLNIRAWCVRGGSGVDPQ
jgi:hypothetical protein